MTTTNANQTVVVTGVWSYGNPSRGWGRSPEWFRLHLRRPAKNGLRLYTTDFDCVSTVAFRILYCFVALRLDRCRVVHFNVTPNSTAPWTAQPSSLRGSRTTRRHDSSFEIATASQ